jgi:hypothetical protein
MSTQDGVGSTEIAVANLSPLQLVQAARAVETTQSSGGSGGTGDGQTAYGPAAATLAAIDPTLVVTLSDTPGDVAVNITNVAGLAWAAAAEAGDRVAALETRVRDLERRLAEFL